MSCHLSAQGNLSPKKPEIEKPLSSPEIVPEKQKETPPKPMPDVQPIPKPEEETFPDPEIHPQHDAAFS